MINTKKGAFGFEALIQKTRELHCTNWINRKGAVVLSNEIIKEVSKDYYPWFYFTLPNNPLSLRAYETFKWRVRWLNPFHKLNRVWSWGLRFYLIYYFFKCYMGVYPKIIDSRIWVDNDKR